MINRYLSIPNRLGFMYFKMVRIGIYDIRVERGLFSDSRQGAGTEILQYCGGGNRRFGSGKKEMTEWYINSFVFHSRKSIPLTDITFWSRCTFRV